MNIQVINKFIFGFAKILFTTLISSFVIFFVIYLFEDNSLLKGFGNNVGIAYFKWLTNFVQFNWGDVIGSNMKIVPFSSNNREIGVLNFLYRTLSYGAAGIILALASSSYLTFLSVFSYSSSSKIILKILSYISGLHIIILCFFIKIVLGHSEGFHILIIIAIAIGSNMFSDIYYYQLDQFTRLLEQDFITAARTWGDSIWKHARRSIGLGLLTQWNALVSTIFTSTIIIEYYFKVDGIGYALRKYLIKPNLSQPELPVESLFFMAISFMVIFIVLSLNLIKNMLYIRFSISGNNK